MNRRSDKTRPIFPSSDTADETVVLHVGRLLDSFFHWTGRELIDRRGSAADQAERLKDVPFVVVSHGPEEDPVLNYGNRAALALWEMHWEEFVRTPSRRTAEPMEQEERARLLARVRRSGWTDDYSGIRISGSGRRFRIERALLWNILDETRRCVGQAATFDRWSYL